jgi:O-antigen/teichoic acid export membrane protein
MIGIGGRIAKGAAWIAASRLVISVLGFVNVLVLARLLTPEDFGLVAIVMAASAIMMAATELSLSQALVQHRDPEEEHYHTAFTINLLRAVIVAAIAVALSGPVAAAYGDARLGPLFLSIGLSALIVGGINPRLALMSRDLVFWQDFATRASDKLVAVVTSIAVAAIWQSYWALVIGVVAGQVCALVVSYVIIPFRPRLSLSRWRDLMSFSVWVGLGQAVNTINWRFDQLLAGYMLGNTQLGYYSVGDRLAVLPTREATQPVAQAVFPGFARLADDPPRLRAAYRRAQTALSAVALPAGVGFAVTAEPLVLLAMGEDWRPVIPVIQILASIFAVQTLATPVQPLAMGLGATRALFNRSLLTLAIRVPITIAGLLAGGLMGLLWARCATGLIGMVINMHLVTRLIAIPVLRQITGNARALAATAAMAAATFGAGQVLMPGDAGNWPALLLQATGMIVTGALVYPAAMFGLWFAAGRPDGPERDMIHFGGASLAAARLRLTARPAG